MNTLVNQEFFQIVLNQFLAIDKDLVSWKLTCTYCYDFIHDIHITCIDVKKCKTVLNNTKIVEIDTTMYAHKKNIWWVRPCECGLTDHMSNKFDLDFLDGNLPDLKVLKLSYMNHSSDLRVGAIVAKLTSLEYLDLGINTYVSNYTFKDLSNLKTLYLRNNCNTSEIFDYLPKLGTVQIGYEIDSNMFYIKPDHVPDRISKVIQNGYSYDCPVRGWQARDGCNPLYQHEEYSIILKSKKN